MVTPKRDWLAMNDAEEPLQELLGKSQDILAFTFTTFSQEIQCRTPHVVGCGGTAFRIQGGVV